MKALIYRKFGRPEVLEWVDHWPEPVLSATDVLVKTVTPGEALPPPLEIA